MAWEQNNLSIDIAEEFASFADLSREDFRREMRAQQQAERRRSRRSARTGLSRAIVKRNCIECGKEFEDIAHRQGDPAKYCSNACSRRVRTRRYKAKKKARLLAMCTGVRVENEQVLELEHCWSTVSVYDPYGAVYVCFLCQ